MLSADLNWLSLLDVQEEVGCLLSCELTKINLIYLKKKEVWIFYIEIILIK